MRSALLLVLVACGGKLGGDDSQGDGAADATPGNASFEDARAVDAGCAVAMVYITVTSDGCKESATWVCGFDVYSAAGGCSGMQTGPLMGSCTKNNVPTKMIFDPKCQCIDARMVAQQLANDCGFPAPR